MSARSWALFAAVSVLWGIPYLFIKIAVDELTPGFAAWSRLALAAVVLLPLALRQAALRGLPVIPVVAFAAVELALPWPLVGYAEQRVSSSPAAILIATVPLMVALLSARYDDAERLPRALASLARHVSVPALTIAPVPRASTGPE